MRRDSHSRSRRAGGWEKYAHAEILEIVQMNTLASAPRRLITVDEFHKMAAAQILSEKDRIELIEGEMIQVAPIGAKHFSKLIRLQRLFANLVGNHATVSVQGPIALPPRNEPQPDIALLKPRTDDYESGLPGASDVLLVVEISDTTLVFDRDAKMQIYAFHGIPEAWIVDVNAKQVMVFLDPGPSGYQQVITPAADATLKPTMVPSISVRQSDLW
jgi:Uma2 family endonuclease